MGGPHTKIRRHTKVTTELPLSVRDEVDRLLIENSTYEEISMFLKEKGYDISKSSIGRYGKEFLNTYRKIKIIEQKSSALISNQGHGMILEEAVTKLFTQQILEMLLEENVDLSDKSRLISDFAKLQASSATREKLKKNYRDRAENAIKTIQKIKNVPEEVLKEIEESIYGIIRH
jgi:intein-encoded DNA endonuclease-like protein